MILLPLKRCRMSVALFPGLSIMQFRSVVVCKTGGYSLSPERALKVYQTRERSSEEI